MMKSGCSSLKLGVMTLAVGALLYGVGWPGSATRAADRDGSADVKPAVQRNDSTAQARPANRLFLNDKDAQAQQEAAQSMFEMKTALRRQTASANADSYKAWDGQTPIGRSVQADARGPGGVGTGGGAAADGPLICLCGTNTEGQIICWQDDLCINRPPCATSADCPAGSTCQVTCCTDPAGNPELLCWDDCAAGPACNNPGVCGTYQACEGGGGGGAQFFTNIGDWEAALAAAGKQLKGTDDYEEAEVVFGPNGIGFPCDPLDTNCANGNGFSPGDILFNIAYQSNIAAPGQVPGIGGGMVVLTTGFAGAFDTCVGPVQFADSLDVFSLNPNHTAISLELVDLAFGLVGTPIDVLVFDKDGALIGAITVLNPGPGVPGVFLGIMTAPDTIGRINIRAHDGAGTEGGELIYRLDAYVFEDAGPCPGPGNCFEANGTPGCNNEACCNLVCDQAPFCCDVEWDTKCAGLAQLKCGNAACGVTGSGDCCDPEGTGSPGCEDTICCKKVCLQDAFCCDVEWDSQCAGDADAKGCCPVCPGEGNCFEANGTPGCEDEGCCTVICDQDSFCCDVEWDQVCADEAQLKCGNAACGVTGSGDCCDPEGTGSPGCEDTICCKKVCLQDAFCCDVEWDSQCAGEADAKGCCPDKECVPTAVNAVNDCCDDRINIGDGDTAFDTTGANTDGPEHASCFDGNGGQTFHDIWYNYTATCTGNLTVSTCNTANYDTDLVVYDGIECDQLEDPPLGCNDDFGGCAGFTSLVVVPVVEGNFYKIRVGGWNDGDQGTGTVNLSCELEAPCEPNPDGPINDCCEDRINIADGITGFDTTGAKTDGPLDCGAGDLIGQDIWYNYTATCTGKLTVTTCEELGGSATFDTILVAYKGLECDPLGGQVGCNDDDPDNPCGTSGGGFHSTMSVDVVLDNTYKIRVGGFQSETGTGDLVISCEEVCIPTAENAVNDCCDDRINVADGLTSFDTKGANTDGPENPEDTCDDFGMFQTYNDIWYNYTATCTGTLTVSTCEDTGGSANYDTDLVIYDGTDCDDLENNFLACNDDDQDHPCGTDDFHSTIVVEVVEGNLYKIRVGGWGSFDEGQGELFIGCEPPGGACCVKLPEGPPFYDCTDDIIEGVCDALGGSFLGVGSVCVVDGIDACDCNENNILDLDELTGTGERDYVVGGLGLPIPDLDADGVCHVINVPDSGIIFDLDVDVQITHGNIADVKITVTHGADTATLWTFFCNGFANMDTIFDDAAADVPCPPVGTVTNPVAAGGTPLSVFNGKEKEGDWIICVADLFPGVVGTLDGWSLHMLNEPTATDCNGNGVIDECENPQCLCDEAKTIDCNSTVDIDNTDNPNPPNPCPTCYGGGGTACEVGPAIGAVWFTFTADDTSMRINTCSSVQQDSTIAVYTGPDCSNLTEVGCGEDECPLFLTDFCFDTVVGQQYWVQFMAWSPGDRGEYTMEISCPCTGACCTDETDVCVDDVEQQDCQGAGQRFAGAKECLDDEGESTFDPPCGSRGACCDDTTLDCTDDTLEVDCTGTRYVQDGLCADLLPLCGGGACCLADGTCVDTVEVDCDELAGQFRGGLICANTICNIFNDCNWDNGGPSDTAPGPSSQYAPDQGFYSEAADDFILKGNPFNDCEINQIVWATTAFNHQAPCVPGGDGGVTCFDSPADFENILLAIYNDTGLPGEGKGPTGEPVGDGTHTGLVKIDLVIPPSDYTFVKLGVCDIGPLAGEYCIDDADCLDAGAFCDPSIDPSAYQITMDIVPPNFIKLEKNKKNWLAIAPTVSFAGHYQSAAVGSLSFNGNPAQQIFELLGLPWTPVGDGDTDLYQQLIGKKQPVDCCIENEQCFEQISQTECEELGGVKVETCDDCDTSPLVDCCLDPGVCPNISEDQCALQGGFQVADCAIDCPAVVNCCLSPGECEVISPDDCAAQGGFAVDDCLLDCPCTTQQDCDDEDVCTCDQCENGVCTHLETDFGNVCSPVDGSCDTNHVVDLDDILGTLNCFANFDSCPNADLAPPCTGNGICDLDDILQVIDAFGGIDPCDCTTNCCLSPGNCVVLTHLDCLVAGGVEVDDCVTDCPVGPDAPPSGGPVDGAPVADLAPPANNSATITLVPRQRTAHAGDQVVVDAFLSGVNSAIRGYQVTVNVVGNQSGEFTLADAEVDSNQPNFVFTGEQYVVAADLEKTRLAGALQEGELMVDGTAYLGTFTFDVSQNAVGSFELVVRGDSMLRDALGNPVVVGGESAVVVITTEALGIGTQGR